MKNLTLELQQELLKLSRDSLTHFFETKKLLDPNPDELPDELKEVRATFVTLTKHGELRGCIGKLIPVKPLYQDIIENSYSAAFNDFRFPKLTKEELQEIKVEISILSLPEVLEYKNTPNLLQVLEECKPGVIISHKAHSATFLPQVWEELKTADEFLSHLCAKAGLYPSIWTEGKIHVQTYQVEKFKEA